MRHLRATERLYAAQSGQAMLWLPVALGIGVWAWVAWPSEPPLWTAGLALPPVLWLATGGAWRAGWGARAAALGLAAAAVGFSAAVLHARAVAAPVLDAMVEETVDGRVLELTRSASGAPRLLLGDVTVYGLEPGETPARLRVTLIETGFDAAPRPGARVRLHARLYPPGEPVEPGAFDFRMRAHFERIGGVGYALGPVLRLPGGAEGAGLAGLRAEIADALRAMLPGAEGAFAAAILVGDRSGIEDADAEALRAANLSHLLAISGLHMGLLCGLVFAGTRLALAAVPALALTLRTKKIAAVAALAAGAGYLALSGATVPTQRAFAMVAVALVAVLLDRPALTLRALGLAAGVVLLMRPVSLLDPGFQMSFAATAALVAVFERLPTPRRGGVAGQVLRYAAALAVSSLVAGAATAPFSAFHFNQTAMWGLPANMAALPVMGLWIAPSAVVAGLAAPLGLAEWPVRLMGEGIGLVLAVAHEVAGWPGAVQPVRAGPGPALGLIALGGLWLVIWAGRWRALGLLGVAGGAALWASAPDRPEVLIAPGARLVGVMGPEGRAVDHPRAQSFVAESWLRRDGDRAAQEVAAARPGLEHGRGWARADLGHGWRLEVMHGRRPDPDRLAVLCAERTLLVVRHGPVTDGPCLYLGEADLARAVAVRMQGGRPAIARGNDRGRVWEPQ